MVLGFAVSDAVGAAGGGGGGGGGAAGFLWQPAEPRMRTAVNAISVTHFNVLSFTSNLPLREISRQKVPLTRFTRNQSCIISSSSSVANCGRKKSRHAAVYRRQAWSISDRRRSGSSETRGAVHPAT